MVITDTRTVTPAAAECGFWSSVDKHNPSCARQEDLKRTEKKGDQTEKDYV
jgi:hypothetical protein